MKYSKLLAGFLSAALLVTIGCSSSEEDTVTPFDWTISASNADNIVKELMEMSEFDVNFGNDLNAATDPAFKAGQNKFITTEQPVPCDKSGTWSSTFTGDFFTGNFDWTLSFAACDHGDGEGAATGTVTIAATTDEVSGDVSGSLSFNITSQGATTVGAISSTTFGADGSEEFSFDLSVTASTGSVSIVTNTNFLRDAGALNPHTGQMTITGPNNGKIRVTAIDANDVQIEVDADGDGTYEYNVIKAWASL